MKKIESPLVWGILLIAVGLLILLQNLGVLGETLVALWALIFAAAGVRFLYAFLTNRAVWWPLIPGLSLLGLAALITLSILFPEAGGTLGVFLFMGAISLSFWIIYFIDHTNWWAIIPGGVLLSLALMIGLSEVLPGDAAVGIFFLGMGLTFVLVALLRTPAGRMRWAWIPAAVLSIMGLIFLAQSAELLVYVWPLALIAVGLIFLFRALAGKNRQQD